LRIALLLSRGGGTLMHRLLLLLSDLLLIALATVLALFIRDDFQISHLRLGDLIPYLLATLLMSALVLTLLRTDRTIWRFSALRDYIFLVLASFLIVSGATALGFAFNRLEGIPRSVPILQGLLIAALLVSVRLLMRLRHAYRKRPAQFSSKEGANTHVLVVGVSHLAELYLRSVSELSRESIKVEGLIAPAGRHKGRLVHQYPVLGTVEDLADVLKALDVHGVQIDRIVIATPFETLSEDARTILLDLERGSGIRVEFLAEQLGFRQREKSRALGGASETRSDAQSSKAAFTVTPEECGHLARRPYWRMKRFLDVCTAAILIAVLSPITLIVGLLVALDVGLPLVFWQQRPGLQGRPFRLYKFRTMAGAHDRTGRRLRDDERLSKIGALLRRTRLDELPQLFNILLGHMSFVGPRPLLPVDQSADHAARLMVRPGLTGWAQVNGGREVSIIDKAVLDIWYLRNASLALDLKIAARTISMVLHGERTNMDAIRKAWSELRQAGLSATL
jgi:lipopolysaccharide/colanic/teichoic acid biosynthesis glycosyltransferase